MDTTPPPPLPYMDFMSMCHPWARVTDPLSGRLGTSPPSSGAPPGTPGILKTIPRDPKDRPKTLIPFGCPGPKYAISANLAHRSRMP